MSEVKSARELANKLEMFTHRKDACQECNSLNCDYVVKLIKEDRRAIIDRCKDAIYSIYGVGEDGKQFKYDALDALDSVLFEIEKEE